MDISKFKDQEIMKGALKTDVRNLYNIYNQKKLDLKIEFIIKILMVKIYLQTLFLQSFAILL